MAKLSKSILKEIVKECIIEIFEESFFAGQPIISESLEDSRARRSSTQKPKRPQPSNSSSRKRHLDNISYNSNVQEAKTERFDQKIEKITSNITDDPIMANIFKDTASTTLQQQMETSKSGQISVLGAGDAAAKKAFSSDPTELFAESAGKWATLAFSESIRK